MRPVVLVHGILGQPHVYWNLFRHRLMRDGFAVHEAHLPYSLLGDVRLAAQALARRVQEVRRAEAAKKVDLVCHSAGGLVARYYVKLLGGSSRVGRLVLLGTPNQGTLTGYAVPLLRIAAQARPGSALLAELNGHPEPVPVTNLWSPVDGIVIPAERCILEAAGVDNVRLPWVHHWGFLVSLRVYERVREVLRVQSDPGPQM